MSEEGSRGYTGKSKKDSCPRPSTTKVRLSAIRYEDMIAGREVTVALGRDNNTYLTVHCTRTRTLPLAALSYSSPVLFLFEKRSSVRDARPDAFQTATGLVSRSLTLEPGRPIQLKPRLSISPDPTEIPQDAGEARLQSPRFAFHPCLPGGPVAVVSRILF